MDYDCPECEKELHGGLGENVYCSVCKVWYYTDFELNYHDDGDETYTGWIDGTMEQW